MHFFARIPQVNELGQRQIDNLWPTINQHLAAAEQGIYRIHYRDALDECLAGLRYIEQFPELVQDDQQLEKELTLQQVRERALTRLGNHREAARVRVRVEELWDSLGLGGLPEDEQVARLERGRRWDWEMDDKEQRSLDRAVGRKARRENMEMNAQQAVDDLGQAVEGGMGMAQLLMRSLLGKHSR